jgi:hypothetical protein
VSSRASVLGPRPSPPGGLCRTCTSRSILGKPNSTVTKQKSCSDGPRPSAPVLHLGCSAVKVSLKDAGALSRKLASARSSALLLCDKVTDGPRFRSVFDACSLCHRKVMRSWDVVQ